MIAYVKLIVLEKGHINQDIKNASPSFNRTLVTPSRNIKERDKSIPSSTGSLQMFLRVSVATGVTNRRKAVKIGVQINCVKMIFCGTPAKPHDFDASLSQCTPGQNLPFIVVSPTIASKVL